MTTTDTATEIAQTLKFWGYLVRLNEGWYEVKAERLMIGNLLGDYFDTFTGLEWEQLTSGWIRFRNNA